MSEHDAHAALTATARMRMLTEPVEDAQLMTFSERQYRAREAKQQHTDGVVDDAVRKHGYHVAVEATPADYPGRMSPRVTLTYRDFRDGRCMHGEGRYSCPICAVQDGRV